MYLKELDLGHEAKCTCSSCNGTGIYKSYSEREDLGVVCNNCNGEGYFTLELNEKEQLVQDEKTGVVYQVSDGLIVGFVSLFEELRKRDDVNYVMYGTGRTFLPEYLFEHGASETNVIRYEEFLEGKLPLPLMRYCCPRQISQSYGDSEFDNDCIYGLLSNCKKFGTRECWEKFYGNAKTIDERRDVLRRLKRL